MHTLVLLRHGESTWNRDNLFTGWVDVPLSEKGRKEAKKAAFRLKEKGFVFDLAFTSFLKRAQETLEIVLKEMNLENIKVEKSWRLNERHYGALEGKGKRKTVEEFGEGQVKIWRRSYNIQPPALTKKDKYYPGNDSLYKDLSENELPLTESLQDVSERFLPFWRNNIIPYILGGQRVLISAHGSVLRALVKELDGLSDEQVEELNIPTGLPLVYELNNQLVPVKKYYLANEKEVETAEKSVKNEIKVK